jgi:exosortase D (VPLPA-CTERM-specific)
MSVLYLRSARIGIPSVALPLVALLICFVEFSGALGELVTRWSGQEEYSHGFLIPAATALLLWMRREAILANFGQPALAGPLLVVTALAMHAIGELSAIYVLSQIAFVIALFGIVLAAGGYPLFKATFIPIAFLIFAIPLPYFIEAGLTLKLQLISSELGASLIRMFQIPVYLEGNVINLGHSTLQIVEACSGLRYLYPLLSIAFLSAYLFQAPLWQRAAVFLSAIPITIVMNSIRIGMVGVTMACWGPDMANEVLHAFEGWIIFVACLAILTAEIYGLTLFSGKPFFEIFHFPGVATTPPIKMTEARRPMFAVLCTLGVVGLTVSFISVRSEVVPSRAPFASFPARIGQWQGHALLIDRETEQSLGLSDYILSDYKRADGKAINFYVAYYASQRKGLSPHSPVVCIPGGGWIITSLNEMILPGAGAEMPINRVVIERNSNRQLVYYWFDERGRKIANEYWAKWYLLADAITKHRTDGSLVRLTTEILPGETERDADERLQSFMGAVLPSLPEYLPSDTDQPSVNHGDRHV